MFLRMFSCSVVRGLGTSSPVGSFMDLFLLKFRNLRGPSIDYSFRENGFQEMAAESINHIRKSSALIYCVGSIKFRNSKYDETKWRVGAGGVVENRPVTDSITSNVQLWADYFS
jgi:hypothetical protein